MVSPATMSLTAPFLLVAAGLTHTFHEDDIEKVIKYIDTGMIKKHVEYLAGDLLEGRLAGTEGERAATEYIAGVFKKSGLKPVGDSDSEGKYTFFKSFEIPDDFIKQFRVKDLQFEPRNCLGMLEGTDPSLKYEVIVIGAHHDHLGDIREQAFLTSILSEDRNRGLSSAANFSRTDDTGKTRTGMNIGIGDAPSGLGFDDEEDRRKADPDYIYNGADDNASGVAMLLSIVDAICDSGIRFKRSILFATFSGEEMGQLGSYNYIKNPDIPVTDHIAMVNIHMVGGNPKKPVYFIDTAATEGNYFRDIIKDSARRSDLRYRIKNEGNNKTRGDHTLFNLMSIPAIMVTSGDSKYYHKASDHPEHLDYERMVKTVECLIRIIKELADRGDAPEFNEETGDKTFGSRLHDAKINYEGLGFVGKIPRSSSIRGLKLDKGSGAIYVATVNEGSTADLVGLKKGDYIITIDGRSLPLCESEVDLRETLTNYPIDSGSTIMVVRKRERVKIEFSRVNNIY